MILFRCSCGAAHQAEDQYGGGTMPCSECGQQVPIPTESDPSVALVYKAGESEDGIPLTMDDIRVKMVAGELAPSDLIWDRDTWRPLSEVVGAAEGGEKPELRLKRKEEDEVEGEDEGELAESLDELSPIQHVDLSADDIEQASSPSKSKKRARKAKPKKTQKSKEEKKREKAEKKARAKEKRKSRGKVYYTIQAVLGILAVALGYKFGFGPLISSVRGMPTIVVVQNHDPVQYTALLGWRRVKQELYNNSFCKFEIFVGMPEHQTLKLVPKNPGQGEPYSVSVPVRPGGSVLVNLKGKGSYGVYEPEAVRREKLETADVKALSAEISRNQAPESALKVSRQIRDLVQPAFKGIKNNEIFLGSQYRFSGHLLMGGSLSGSPPKEQKAPEKPLPLVTSPPMYRLQFVNGYGVHNATDEDLVERGLTMPVTVLNLNRARILKVTSPVLEFRGDGKVLRLAMRLPTRAKVQTEGKTFSGNWDYSASCPLSGPKANQWTWRWFFRGQASEKGKNYELQLTINSDGKESRKVIPR